MDIVKIYECLCDLTRLRILHLLQGGPLCVCHLLVILAEPQVKISKHLSYLKNRGLVEVRRDANWMIYSLPPKERRSRELNANLACLQDCAAENTVLKKDAARLAKLDLACAPASMVTRTGRRKACC